MINVISGMANLRELSLNNCSSIDDDFIKALVKHCKLLKILRIPKCKITDAAMKDLAQLELTGLNISNAIVSCCFYSLIFHI